MEPKECVKLPFKCELEEYDPWLVGTLTLADVDTTGWPPSWNWTETTYTGTV